MQTIKNKIFTLLTLLSLLILGGFTTEAWGGQAHVYAYSSPQDGGYVYVANSNAAPASYSKTKDEAQQGGFGSSGNKTFYLFYSANEGYEFISWVKTNASNYNNATTITNTSDFTSQGQSVVQSATGVGAQNSYYAAVFKALPKFYFKATATTNNSTYGNAYVTFDEESKSSATTTEVTPNFYGEHYNSTSLTKTAYFRAVPKSGYVFKGWSTDNTEANIFNTATSITYVLTSSSKNSESPATIQYYAIFGERFAPQITGTASVDKKVGDSYTADFTFTNTSSATPSSSNTADFYYTITHELSTSVNNGTNVISYTPSTGAIQALNAGKATIKFINKSTSTHQNAEVSFVINVSKKTPTFSCGTSMQVCEDLTCTYTNTSDNTPTANSLDNFYYVFTNNTPTGNVDGSDTPGSILTFSDNKVYGKNAGTATITFYQKETYMYSSANKAVEITVSKRSNVLTCSWGNSWTKTLNFDGGSYVNISSTYSGEPALMSVTPIVVTQTEGDSIATFWPDSTTTDDPNGDAVYASCYIGNATWSVNQDENYKYLAAETKTLTAQVRKRNDDGCYLIDTPADKNDKPVSGIGQIYLGGVGDVLTFQMKWRGTPAGNDAILYTSPDGTNWDAGQGISATPWPLTSSSYDTDGNSKTINLPAGTRYIRFEKDGSDDPYVRNIKVTRKQWFKLTDNGGKEYAAPANILNMPVNELGGNSQTATFKVDYSVCDVDYIKLVSNHPHITFGNTNDTTYKFASEGEGTQTITLKYTCATIEEIDATITVYTPYDNKTLIVRAETEKKTQEIRWRTGYQGASLTLPVDLSTDTAAYVSSGLTTPPVVYSTNNPEVIRIYDDRTGFEIIDAGTAQLTASHEGDEEYKSATDTKTITATYKKIQIIVWGQDLTRLHTGDSPINLTAKVMEVDAEGNMSESDRTAYIQYNVLDGNVVSVAGTTLTIGNAGQTTITAYVPGNDTIEEASTVTPVRVSPASANDCDYGNLEYTATFDKHENKDEGYIEGDDYILFFDDIFHGATSFPELSVTFTITDPIGVPGQFSFKHKGTRYGVGKLSTFEGNIEVRISDDGSNWSGVIWSEKPTVGEYKIATIPLQRTTRYVKFTRPQGGTGYHHIGSVVISPAQYMEADDVNFGNRQAGEVFAKSDVTVNYSNLKGDYIYVTSDTSVVTVTPAVIPVECGSVDNRQFTITCAPTARGTIDSRVILRESISGLTDTIHVTANVEQGSQTITWNPERTTFQVVESAELTAVLPTKTNKGQTVTLESSDPTVVDIIAGQAVIYKPGNVTITASQAGNANFAPAENVEKDFVITLANLSLTAPSASSINDEQPLSASVLTGGNATDVHGPVDGTWRWESPETVYAVGTYYPRVIFTPNEHPEWYTGNTTTTTIVITPSSYRYEGNGQWSEAGHWNKGKVPTINDDVIINGNVTIPGEANAKSLTINEGSNVTLSVSGQLTIGSGNSKVLDNYGNLHVENGGKVILNEGDLKVKDFILDAQLSGLDANKVRKAGKSGQVKNPHKIITNSKAYFDLTFDPSGKISFGWYDFTVPFSVNIQGGIARVNSINDKVMESRKDFIIMEFDEADHANGGKGWRRKYNGVLQPGRLYSVTFNYQKDLPQNTFRFTWNGEGSLANGDEYSAQYTHGDSVSMCGWNGVGNGMLRQGYISSTISKAQVFNHTENKYELLKEDCAFAVGTAFFIQVDYTKTVNWNVYSEDAKDGRVMYAPKRAAQEVEEFHLSIREENSDESADELYVSANEDATDEYVIGRDLMKMGTPTEAKSAQMWVRKRSANLCDIEMPLVYGEANCDLNVFAPADGTYLLEIENGPADAELYLTFNGKVIWDLTSSPASLVLKQGLKEGFGLRMKYNDAPGMAEGVDDINDDTQSMRKVLIDNKIYIITPEGAMYDVNGKLIR